MKPAADGREGFAAFLLRMRARGIDNRALFAAVEATPRALFVPSQWQSVAWSERMVPIECGEAIEGLDLQALVLHALGIEPGHRVLEIGTGSGYTAAVAGRLANRVLSLERYRLLSEQAREHHLKLGLGNIAVRQADGAAGAAAEGPFDRIVAWCAFTELPRGFVDQLSTGGVMVAPIGPPEDVQAMAKLTKIGSRFDREDIAEVRLQPFVGGMAAAI